MARKTFEGKGITPLTGAGTIHVYESPEPEAETGDSTLEPEIERERFLEAREETDSELSTLRDRTAESVGEEDAAVFNAHQQFLDDPQLESAIIDAIEEGSSAEAAVKEVYDDAASRFASMEGRMAERADDLYDLRDRLIAKLTGADLGFSSLPADTVLVADTLLPSDVVDVASADVEGIITIQSSDTSHAAILARSMGIPAVMGIDAVIDDFSDGERALVDGVEDKVIVDPTESDITSSTSGEVSIISDQITTVDDYPVEVAANIGSVSGAESATEYGADGIGLFRTEFLFIDRQSPPTEDEQIGVYRDVLETYPDDRVVVRTLDIGGDKPVPALGVHDDDTNFLGRRGIRLSLTDHREVFTTQLRALMRVAADHDDLCVMFPMVSNVTEVMEALDLVDEVANRLEADGVSFARPSFGVMIETPAAAMIADELAQFVDFFSIGTNDLTQYVMAAARDDDDVADLRDERMPAVLRTIATVVESADGEGCWVGVCGELAADTDITEFLVGLGIDELSMSAVSVPGVKAAVRDVDRQETAQLVESVLESATRADVTEVLESDY